MASSAPRDDLMPRRPGGLGRGAVLALLVHVGLIIAIAFSVNWRNRDDAGVQAELWAAVPQAAAPAPAPAPPAPKPEPKPEPPKPEPKPEPAPEPKPVQPDPQIAIEKAKREEKERVERERERAEAEKQKQERERVERAERDKREAAEKREAAAKAERERKAEEARLAEAREQQMQRVLGMAGAAGASPGTAAQSAGPSAGYAGRLKARIKPNIVFVEDLPGNPTAEVEVRAAPDGTITARRLMRSSGSREWDEAVLRAIDRTEVLPRDVDGRVPSPIVISFRPRE